MPEAAPLQLAWEFIRIGLISFGAANLPEMERVLVTMRGWIDARTLAGGLALGQLMPGPNLLAVTHYGYAIQGLGGALIATAAFYVPTSALSAGVARLWDRHRANTWVNALRSALLPFGAGVMLASTLVLARTSLHGWTDLLITAVAFGLLWYAKVNSAVVVLGAAVLGVLLSL